jgi:hypothetical protein
MPKADVFVVAGLQTRSFLFPYCWALAQLLALFSFQSPTEKLITKTKNPPHCSRGGLSHSQFSGLAHFDAAVSGLYPVCFYGIAHIDRIRDVLVCSFAG